MSLCQRCGMNAPRSPSEDLCADCITDAEELEKALKERIERLRRPLVADRRE